MHVGGHARVDRVRLKVGVEKAFTVAVERFIVAFEQKRVRDLVPNFANSLFRDTSVDNVLNGGWRPGCGQNWNQNQNRGRGMTPLRAFHHSRSSRSNLIQSNQTRTFKKVVRAFLLQESVFILVFIFKRLTKTN